MRSKLQLKIIGSYTLAAILLIGILSFFISDKIFSKIADDIITYNVEGATQQITQQVKSYLDESDQVVKNIIFSREIGKNLEEINKMTYMDGYQKLVFDRLFDRVVEESSTTSLISYSYMSIYSNSLHYRYQYNDLEVTNFEKLIQETEKREYLMENKHIIYSNSKTNEENKIDTFSIVRPIITLKGEQRGYIEFQQSYSRLDEICRLKSGDIFILNPWGECIYPPKPENDIRDDVKQIFSKEKCGYINEENIFYSWDKINFYDCTVILRQDRNVLFKSLEQLKEMMILIIIVVLILSLLFNIFISKIILNPIQKLKEQVVKIDFDHMQVKTTSVFYTDEVKLFQNAFSEMLERVKKSAEESLVFQQEQERAKYDALQAQISPHFIHNTLYSISISAQEHREDDVVSMCKQLSNMLRYTASSKENMVSLKEELNYVRSYLELQKRNYEKSIQYEIVADEKISELKVPRICIQPFVENSIVHGFRNCVPPYKMKIICKRDFQGYDIIIRDNGCGFTEVTLSKLREKINHTENLVVEGFGGMGIVNTVMRLRYIFSNNIEVIIQNEIPGAQIQIHIVEERNV